MIRLRVYISGPMTGLPNYNYPAFEAAAEHVTAAGLEPVSPTQIGQRDGWTWDDYMEAAIELQRDCDVIFLLPGWRESRGATVEYYVALALGQHVWESDA